MDGRSVRGVVGAHWREESADFLNTNTTSGAINFDVENPRNVKAAFAEVYAPLLSGSDNRSEADVLATSLAIRYEDYSDVGSSLDYRAGLNWSPVEGFVLRGTYGTSFRAPRLDQLRDVVSLAVLSIYVDPESPTGESVALLVNGNTSDIDPEEADTWTAGFDFQPAAMRGLNLRATYFSIEYDGRVGIPDFEFDAQFRISNFTGEPVRGVDGATVQSVIDDALTYLDFTFGSASVDDITVLIPQFPQNLSLSEVSGIDLDVTYDVPVRRGRLEVLSELQLPDLVQASSHTDGSRRESA